jgi:hypothetical protein
MPGTPGRSGNFQLGQDATAPDGPPDVPVGISTAGRAKWFALMDEIPQDILRQVDQHQLRMLSELLALADRYQATVAADPADHKTARLLLQVAQQVSRLSAAYGLAPSDRKRLNIKAPTEPDEFQQWLDRATGGP